MGNFLFMIGFKTLYFCRDYI